MVSDIAHGLLLVLNLFWSRHIELTKSALNGVLFIFKFGRILLESTLIVQLRLILALWVSLCNLTDLLVAVDFLEVILLDR